MPCAFNRNDFLITPLTGSLCLFPVQLPRLFLTSVSTLKLFSSPRIGDFFTQVTICNTKSPNSSLRLTVDAQHLRLDTTPTSSSSDRYLKNFLKPRVCSAYKPVFPAPANLLITCFQSLPLALFLLNPVA